MATNSPWIIDSPVSQGENAVIAWGITWPKATTVGASTKTVAVYKKGTTTNVASTVMPSGSHIAYGNLLALKALQLLTGGEKYIISITIDIDGVTDEYFMEVWALKSETGKL